MFNRFSALVVALFLSPLIACTPAEGRPDTSVENAPIAEGRVETMETPTWVTDLFRAVDTMDAERFVAFMAEDVFFRAGSAESLRGRAAVRDDIGSLFSRIKGINHELSDTWVQGDVVVVQTVKLLRSSSAAAAEFVRTLSDEQLDKASPVSGNWDAPLTTRYFIEQHAIGHSYRHRASIRAALDPNTSA